MIVPSIRDYVVAKASGRNVFYVGASDDNGRIADAALKVKAVAKSWWGLDIDRRIVTDEFTDSILIADLNGDFSFDVKGVDLVIMTEVLEHLVSPANTLRRLAESFPGCDFLGSVPNGMAIGRVFMGLLSPSMYNWQDGRHMMLFNPNTLRNTLKFAGMDELRIIPYEQRRSLRWFTKFRPDFASGYIIEAKLPNVKSRK